MFGAFECIWSICTKWLAFEIMFPSIPLRAYYFWMFRSHFLSSNWIDCWLKYVNWLHVTSSDIMDMMVSIELAGFHFLPIKGVCLICGQHLTRESSRQGFSRATYFFGLWCLFWSCSYKMRKKWEIENAKQPMRDIGIDKASCVALSKRGKGRRAHR